MVFYTTHNIDPDLGRNSVVGTSKLTTVIASYDRLFKLFGHPLRSLDPAVTKAEWIVQFEGKILTIYDYNTGKSAKDNKHWSIGGFKLSGDAAIELALVIYRTDEEK